MADLPAAAEAAAQPPAGQMCPQGSYVIGFDAGTNIICSSVAGDEPPVEPVISDNQRETTDGDGAAAPAAAAVAPVAASAERAAPSASATTSAAPVAAPAAVSAAAKLQVTDVEPSSVVYGKREVTITLAGTGFTADSVIRFAGADYRPSVSTDGTRLTVTLPTRDLSIGNYPITVTNGSGDQVRAEKKLSVF